MTPEEHSKEIEKCNISISNSEKLNKLLNDSDYKYLFNEQYLNNLIAKSMKDYIMYERETYLNSAKKYASLLVYFDDIKRNGEYSRQTLNDLNKYNFN